MKYAEYFKELEQRITTLEERVSMLEHVVDSLNTSTEEHRELPKNTAFWNII